MTDLERTTFEIEHLHRSLVNAQETIRFVDTKNAAVTSLSLLLLSGAVSAMHFMVSAAPPYFKFYPLGADLNLLTAAALLVAFVSFILCLTDAAKSLLPKSPNKRATLLFPFYSKHITYQIARDELFRAKGAEGIREEYEIQLEILGNILAAKIPACNKSIRWFMLQVWATAIFALFGLFLIGGAGSVESQGQGHEFYIKVGYE